jgi:hypothetical protein
LPFVRPRLVSASFEQERWVKPHRIAFWPRPIFSVVNGFYTQYAHARDIGLDCLADRVLEIAETPLVAEKRVQKADGSVEITTADAGGPVPAHGGLA